MSLESNKSVSGGGCSVADTRMDEAKLFLRFGSALTQSS
jgi:hypothetical protein